MVIQDLTPSREVGTRNARPDATDAAQHIAADANTPAPRLGRAREVLAGRLAYRFAEEGAFHEKMVAISERTSLVYLNKTVYICCLAVFAMLAASPMRAAEPIVGTVVEPAAASSLLSSSSHAAQASSGHTVSTIRVDPRTGKLIRVMSGSPASARPTLKAAARPIAPPPARINELVEQSARAHQVDPLLVHSVIQVESNYNLYAVSNKGAEGLMQLMPSTSRMLGVVNSFDPVENIEAGVKYLKYLQSLYHDDRLALAAYNAGPSAVAKYSEVPPYPETQNYVERVGERYRAAHAAAASERESAAKSTGAGNPPAAGVPEPEAREPQTKVEQFIDSDGRLHLQTVPRTQ